MKITLKQIPVRAIAEKYVDLGDEGVFAYDNNLTVRPAYQREYIYDDKRRNAVVDSVFNGFPINVMYWAYIPANKASSLPEYELLDGQQRTLSILKYIKSDFSVDYRYFHNLTEDEQAKILDYNLQVYICEGTESERLAWFKRINVAGLELNNQELLNSTYTGAWLEGAKKYFSKPSSPIDDMTKGYMNGNKLRQGYLEQALKWIADRDGVELEEYMSKHQQDKNANDLWLYFSRVIEWAKLLFPKVRKEMKSVEWGLLYNKYKDNDYDSDELEQEVSRLMEDDEVQNPKGIYYYLFSGDEKDLRLRTFNEKEKTKKYEEQAGICPICKKHFEFSDMHGDHLKPWSKGGKTTPDNLVMLCRKCNLEKSDN